jgi:hypothetical protein
MKGKPLRALIIGAMLIVGLDGSASGTASISDGPTTRAVTAAFQVKHDSREDQTATCSGPDGNYREIRAHSVGAQISTDDRFSGVLTTEEWILLNVTTLEGTVEINVELRDPTTAALKFSGHVYGVLKGLVLKGVEVGTLADGSRVIANFSAVHDPPVQDPHNVTGEIGGPATVPLDLAMLQRGSCSGTVGP